MTDRSHLYRVITDAQGNIRTGTPLTVTIYHPGTTTAITDVIYADNTSGATLTNPLVTSAGIVDFYLVAPQRVDLKVDDGSTVALYQNVDVGGISTGGGKPAIAFVSALPITSGALPAWIAWDSSTIQNGPAYADSTYSTLDFMVHPSDDTFLVLGAADSPTYVLQWQVTVTCGTSTYDGKYLGFAFYTGGAMANAVPVVPMLNGRADLVFQYIETLPASYAEAPAGGITFPFGRYKIGFQNSSGTRPSFIDAGSTGLSVSAHLIVLRPTIPTPV